MQMQLVSRRARALRLVRFIGLLCTTVWAQTEYARPPYRVTGLPMWVRNNIRITRPCQTLRSVNQFAQHVDDHYGEYGD